MVQAYFMKNMQLFLKENGLSFKDGRIDLPLSTKRIFLDIGLSNDAHQSEILARSNYDFVIFAFEPLTQNIEEIARENSSHSIILNAKRIGKEVFLLPCALGKRTEESFVDFYVTKSDRGCSSLIQPASFEIQEIVQVPIFSLEEFLVLIPWSEFGYIDYVKIDAQGSDLDIISGAGALKNRILLVTCELSIDQYVGISNDSYKILLHMLKSGFLPVTFGKNHLKLSRICKFFFWLICILKKLDIEIESVDPTFVNVRLLFFKRLRSLRVYID